MAVTSTSQMSKSPMTGAPILTKMDEPNPGLKWFSIGIDGPPTAECVKNKPPCESRPWPNQGQSQKLSLLSQKVEFVTAKNARPAPKNPGLLHKPCSDWHALLHRSHQQLCQSPRQRTCHGCHFNWSNDHTDRPRSNRCPDGCGGGRGGGDVTTKGSRRLIL